MTGPLRDPFSDSPSGGDAPDLTPQIMKRLGYMRVPARVARRRRRRNRGLRLATVVAALSFIAIGLHLHDIGATSRRPKGPTINSALRSDVGRTQQHLDRTIQTIQNFRSRLAPAPGVPTFEPHQPDEPRSITRPPAWRPFGPAGGPGTPDLLRAPSADMQRGKPDRIQPEPFDEDVEYLALGPVRWL